MEGKKQGGSSSSFVSDLFGSQESAPRGSFGSIFAPESKAQRRESMRYHSSVEKKQDYFNQESNSKTPAAADNYTMTKEEEKKRTTNKFKNSYYPEQKLLPCPLSSSIYYGGQDVYTFPQNSQDSTYSTENSRYSSYNIDEEDDSGSASRGNWWQGSLYY